MRIDWGQMMLSAGVAIAASLATIAATVGLGPSGDNVRAYLMTHPEVIPEAMTALEARDTGRAIAGNRTAIETPVGDAWTGNPKGDVTVVEFFDYNCVYCRAALPTIAALVKADPQVKVVFRELPILAQSSYDAAKLSYAAARQGKFNAFHDTLYAAGRVTPDSLAATAKKAGIDLAAAKAVEGAAEAEVKRNVGIARDLKTSGTPTFVVGDRVLVGMQTLDSLQDAVKQARARK